MSVWCERVACVSKMRKIALKKWVLIMVLIGVVKVLFVESLHAGWAFCAKV